MSFLWVEVLWFLALLPALVMGYVALLRRRRNWGGRYPGLAMVAAAALPSWQRYTPQAMFLAGLAVLIVAAARPVAPITLLARQQTIILAMDVSPSMQAEDVWPDRLTASQSAAKAFVDGLPREVRVGIVAYGGTAHVVQPPTHSHEAVFEAIDGFRLQRGTAIGSGLLYSLATLFPHAGIDVEGLQSHHTVGRERPINHRGDDGETPQIAPVPPGSYTAAVIVLLSDGQNTTGVDPLEAASLAAGMGVKVYTVGFGTLDGDIIKFAGRRFRVGLDEQTLRQIAAVTRGEYFHAASGPELQRAYDAMTSRMALETHETELTALFAGLGALLILIGSGLSIGCYGRVF
jgi:Ca-activated chloride channel family protein